jgi:hypothetical protein
MMRQLQQHKNVARYILTLTLLVEQDRRLTHWDGPLLLCD